MKKFNVIMSVALFIGATSCTEEIIVQSGSDSKEPIELSFTASSEEVDVDATTRTLVRDGVNVYWIANDMISLFANSSNNQFITKNGGIVTDFHGTVNETADTYYALYPYDKSAQIDGSTVTTVLYAQQFAEPDSYASGMNLSTAFSSTSEAHDLGFKHAPSYLAVHISSNYQGDDIASMELRGKSGEKLAGEVNINVTQLDEEGELYPVATLTGNEASEVIYLNQKNPYTRMLPGKVYYFVLAPQTFEEGYVIRLVNTQGQICDIVKEEGPYVFERNGIRNVMISEATFIDRPEVECERDAEGNYVIYDIACLYDWADEVITTGDYDLGFSLQCDIDFTDSNKAWPEIGSATQQFTGTIKGNGHVIKNMTIGGDNRQFAGFIGSMGAGGRIENLTFENPKVSSTWVGKPDKTTDDGYVGVIVGMLNQERSNNYTGGTISNCNVINPTLDGGENVGGILGRSFGDGDLIEDCSVSGGTLNGHMFVGGISGNLEGTIENCHVSNTPTLSYHSVEDGAEIRMGGIVGTNSGLVIACTANAHIKGTKGSEMYDGRYVGGLVGANNSVIIASASAGTVESTYGGGLVGESYGNITGAYSLCDKALIYYANMNVNVEAIPPTFTACYRISDDPDAVVIAQESETLSHKENVGSVSDVEDVQTTLNSAISSTGYQFGTRSSESKADAVFTIVAQQ